jgi:hypothetical protein
VTEPGQMIFSQLLLMNLNGMHISIGKKAKVEGQYLKMKDQQDQEMQTKISDLDLVHHRHPMVFLGERSDIRLFSANPDSGTKDQPHWPPARLLTPFCFAYIGEPHFISRTRGNRPICLPGPGYDHLCLVHSSWWIRFHSNLC